MSRKESYALSGKTQEFYTPDYRVVTIREQNGEDEEILSNSKNLLKGDAINFFLSRIIMTVDGDKVSTDDVLNLKNKTKYYILLKSRLLSLGNEITYKHKCSNPNCPKPQGLPDTTFEEDLDLYDLNFDPANTVEKAPFKYRVTPYPDKSTHRLLTLGTGKELKYKYLTGVEEKKLIEMPADQLNKNTDIVVRQLEWKQETGTWVKVQNFRDFSSKEMAEIRKDIVAHDMPFEAVSECTCPYCNTTDLISLMSQSDFFFPGEM